MRMASLSTQDPSRDARHITTDPGLSPESGAGEANAKKSTDPGIAPPSVQPARLEVVDPTAPTPPPDESNPSFVRRHEFDASPELPPAAPRFGGEPTPVPAEMTDGLLSGLIASESEAYFRRAKAASASSGDAAAAFHGGPRALAPGSPTPAPEPPVLLRRSVEMDIVEAERAGVIPSKPEPQLEDEAENSLGDTTDPNPGDFRRRVPLDPTLPLPAPRAPWLEKALAFGIAVVAVSLIGVLLVRWLSGNDPGPSAPVSAVSPVGQEPVVAAQPVAPPQAAVPIPPPPAAETVVPSPQPVNQAATPSAAEPPVRSSKGPGPRVTPRAAQGTGGPAPETLPPPKDDVKRSM
jgi:hypothetical protein